MNRFAITRQNGKSNSDVVLDLLIEDLSPGTTYSYDRIGSALSEGTEKTYDKATVQQIVRQCQRRLLKEQRRALQNVPTVGYQIVEASGHVPIAAKRRRKGDKQYGMSLEVLKNVRWDEMNEAQREAHKGQLMLTAAVYEKLSAFERTQERQNQAMWEAIAGIKTEQPK